MPRMLPGLRVYGLNWAIEAFFGSLQALLCRGRRKAATIFNPVLQTIAAPGTFCKEVSQI